MYLTVTVYTIQLTIPPTAGLPAHELYLYNWNVCTSVFVYSLRGGSLACSLHWLCAAYSLLRTRSRSLCPMGFLYFVVFVSPVVVIVVVAAVVVAAATTTTNLASLLAVNALSALLLFLAFNSQLNGKSTVQCVREEEKERERDVPECRIRRLQEHFELR